MFISKRFFVVICLASVLLASVADPTFAKPREGKLRILITGSNLSGMRYTLGKMSSWIARSGYIPVRDDPTQRVKPPHDAVAYLEDLVVFSTNRNGGGNVSLQRVDVGGNWYGAGRRVKPNITIVGPNQEVLATTVDTSYGRASYGAQHSGRVRFGRVAVNLGLGSSEGDSLTDALDRYFDALPPLVLPEEAFEEPIQTSQPGQENPGGVAAWRCDLANGKGSAVQVTGPEDAFVTILLRDQPNGRVLCRSTHHMNRGVYYQNNSGQPAFVQVWIGRNTSGAPKFERRLAAF